MGKLANNRAGKRPEPPTAPAKPARQDCYSCPKQGTKPAAEIYNYA